MEITVKQIVEMQFSNTKFAEIETGEQRLERLIIKYAKQKCEEQREICSQVDAIGYRIETLEDEEEHRDAVKNAKEPDFD